MCMKWSSRILNAADQIPGERSDRHERYRTWSMNPASADALLQTLLALSIHSLVLDAITDGRPCMPETISQMRFADISHAATKRPSHELLAGLPPLSDDDHLSVNAGQSPHPRRCVSASPGASEPDDPHHAHAADSHSAQPGPRLLPPCPHRRDRYRHSSLVP